MGARQSRQRKAIGRFILRSRYRLGLRGARWRPPARMRHKRSEQPLRYGEECWGMSSYVSYCQDQAADCARRARLASSPEIVAYCRSLELRWLRLAEQAQEAGGAVSPHRQGAAVFSEVLQRPANEPYPARRAGRFADWHLRTYGQRLNAPERAGARMPGFDDLLTIAKQNLGKAWR